MLISHCSGTLHKKHQEFRFSIQFVVNGGSENKYKLVSVVLFSLIYILFFCKSFLLAITMRSMLVSIVLIYQFVGIIFSADSYIVEPGPVVLATKGIKESFV